MQPLTISLIQSAASPTPEKNLAFIRDTLGDPSLGELLLFPECITCQGRGETIRRAAQSEEFWGATLGNLCSQFSRAAVFGGVPVSEKGKIFNSALAYSATGALLARYDKIHLFQLNLGQPGEVDEAQIYEAGEIPVAFNFNGWKIALAICYDLRFPELFRALAPFDLLLLPAAFTAQTGVAHWKPLLQARAIENQCFVAAANQCGKNLETNVENYGHSQIFGPWGTCLAGVAEKPASLTKKLNPEKLREVRAQLPALENRRLFPDS